MRRLIRPTIVLSVGVAVVLGALDAAGVGAAGATVNRAGMATQTTGHLVFRGTVNLGAAAARLSQQQTAATSGLLKRAGPLHTKSAPRAKVSVPNPPSTPVLSGPSGAAGFAGLTTADSASVNGFDVEPPDQGLCAHRGTVLEAVNLAIRGVTENGIALTGTAPLNAFFGQPPAVDTSHNPPRFGPFLSDPRCYYDAQTARWFVTVLEIDVNPYSGAFAYRSSELIAVSQTSDPAGGYGLFSFDTTNNGTGGTPSEPNCPCFGDQPRIGADANGFYISTDSYPIHGLFNSNGGEVYAISKQGLAAAASGSGSPPTLVAIHVGAVPIQGYPANAVQPAETPQGGGYAANREYFLSTPDFNGFATMGGAGAKAVVLWTLSGTSSLSSPTPTLTLSDAIIPSEAYAPPAPAAQKPGPRPLGASLLHAPISPLSVNDDRMQQVEFAAGQLYSSLNTGVGSNGKVDRSGAAWFVVKPNGTSGTVTHQGYVAIGNGASVMYPAIGLNPGGKGVMTFSISGPTYYPSGAYQLFNGSAPAPAIHVTSPGTAPEDGFTCYAAFGFGPACRWGDYSAASSDGAGRIVMGNEMIPNTIRDQIANWGTFLSSLKP